MKEAGMCKEVLGPPRGLQKWWVFLLESADFFEWSREATGRLL